jgi:hypothetical protein
MLSPKANSQQIETVRGKDTVRDHELSSGRLGLQRKALNNSISNSISNDSNSYGDDYSDEMSPDRINTNKDNDNGAPKLGSLMRAMSMHKRLSKRLTK